MIAFPLTKGPGLALVSALLFGASVPAAKVLLGDITPALLAGLLYLGAGLGLALWRLARRSREAHLGRADLPWLAGAVLAGGVVSPVLLMYGLASTPAANASLLLNLEGVFTTALAWFVFHENFDRRIALGAATIIAGGILLSWSGLSASSYVGPLLIVLACLGWGIDNNLTRRISGADPATIAGIKGLVAGGVNIGVALALGATVPGWQAVSLAAVVGFLGYGLSLMLFVLALRHLGAARTGAYFGVAPFFGAIIALIAFDGAASVAFWFATALMALGVWLHLSERHAHWHVHEALEHTHAHVHDEHHRHVHDFAWDGHEPHTHWHRHDTLAHAHPHYPDLHHRHRH